MVFDEYDTQYKDMQQLQSLCLYLVSEFSDDFLEFIYLIQVCDKNVLFM